MCALISPRLASSFKGVCSIRYLVLMFLSVVLQCIMGQLHQDLVCQYVIHWPNLYYKVHEYIVYCYITLCCVLSY